MNRFSGQILGSRARRLSHRTGIAALGAAGTHRLRADRVRARGTIPGGDRLRLDHAPVQDRGQLRGRQPLAPRQRLLADQLRHGSEPVPCHARGQGGAVDRHQHRGQRPGGLHRQAQPRRPVPQRQADRRACGAGQHRTPPRGRGAQHPGAEGATWEAPDAQTLRIRTSQPDPWIPNYFALGYMPIFNVDAFDPKADPASWLGKGYFSGPLRVTSLTPQQMTLDAVPNAWDGAPKVAGVDVKFIKDPQARLAALKTGEIDMMLYVPADGVPLVKSTAGPVVQGDAQRRPCLGRPQPRPAAVQRGGRAPGARGGHRPQADRRDSAQRRLQQRRRALSAGHALDHSRHPQDRRGRGQGLPRRRRLGARRRTASGSRLGGGVLRVAALSPAARTPSR